MCSLISITIEIQIKILWMQHSTWDVKCNVGFIKYKDVKCKAFAMKSKDIKCNADAMKYKDVKWNAFAMK